MIFTLNIANIVDKDVSFGTLIRQIVEMNFLSHYYFERFAAESEKVVGCLLPDLLKNVNKKYIFHPIRFHDRLSTSPTALSLLEGWYRHVEVDRLFHNSDFFIHHRHELRKILAPVVQDTPIRASFLAHIALELILDHRLIKDESVKVVRLYEHLEAADRQALRFFLNNIGLGDTQDFFEFYKAFIESKYMVKYEEIHFLSCASLNICKRLWTFEISDYLAAALTNELTNYTENKLGDYREVFHYIQDQLS